MKRSSEDVCLICQKAKSTKRNSHCIPAGLLTPTIGSRDKEESYKFDFASGDIDAFFGRANVKNNEHQILTEHKDHHYALDFIFCPECEKRLGNLESKVLPSITNEFRNNTHSYVQKAQPHGLIFRELIAVDCNDFLVFFFSLMFRYDILIRNTKGVDYFHITESNNLRQVIYEYLYDGVIDKTKDVANLYQFNLLTKEQFGAKEATHVFSIVEQDNPNIIYFCEFIIFWYSKNDTIAYNNPFLMFNKINNNASVIIISDMYWQTFIQKMLDIIMPDFIQKVGERFSNINGKNLNENKDEFIRLVKSIKLTAEQEKITSPVQEALKYMIEKYEQK